MRSLLLALDDTPGGAGASTFALDLAARHNAAITGASILDISYLTAPGPGGIGTAHFKARADRARLQRGHDLTERLSDNFLRQCKARKLKGSVLALEGSPSEELRAAADAYDVVVIGHDSDLHGEADNGLAVTVEKILHENPRPLIITPAEVREPSSIVVAFDGSVPSARSLQIFTLLGLAKNCEIHVVSVATSKEVADRNAKHAGAYLGLYDIAFKSHAIVSHANPADVVMDEAKARGAALIVMGAYGHRGWKEALLGSFTSRLLENCPTALFIHH